MLARMRRVPGFPVLVGDPGRRYFPGTGFEQLAAYEVHTTTELEDRDVVSARVFTLPGPQQEPLETIRAYPIAPVT